MKTKPIAYVVFYEERPYEKGGEFGSWTHEQYVTEDREDAMYYVRALKNPGRRILGTIRNVSKVTSLYPKGA